MADWSRRNPATPTHIHSESVFSAEAEYHLEGVTGSAFGVLTWGAANLAIYIPFSIPWSYPIRRVFWVNGSTVTGNMAFGIYSSGGSKIYASASTAQSGASVPQYVSSLDFILPAGRYYMAQLCSAVTASLAFGATITAIDGRMRGLLQQAVGSMTFPNTMTGAQYAQVYVPLCGFTRTPSGF